MRRVWWVWSVIWIWGCGAGIGMIHPVDRQDPLPQFQPSIGLHFSGFSQPWASELYIRWPVAYLPLSAVGLGFYRFVGTQFWQSPVPLPIVGPQLGLLMFSVDSFRFVVGGHLALAMEWTFLRNGKPINKIGGGEFLWWYLQTRAGILMFPWRFVSPRIAVEIGFRVSSPRFY